MADSVGFVEAAEPFRRELLAAVAYTRDRHGAYQPYGICVLTVTDAGIRRIFSFGEPGLVTVFDSFPALVGSS